MNNNYLYTAIIFLMLTTSCSGQLDRLLPKHLDDRGEAKLVRTSHDARAMALFSTDASIREALAEFKPAGISAGEYNFGGILINLGLARCNSADEAYGIYSALTAMPRERWEFKRGEMSYKPPYFAGYSGEYVFWTYSPTNPMTYAAFYRSHGERILTEFEKTRTMPGCSYHWKILPAENRYADSIYYVKSRNINGLDIFNAYAATYQVQKNLAHIYVQKFGSDKEAESRYSGQASILKQAGKKLEEFIPVPGAPVRAIRWKEQGGEWTLLQYRWLVMLVSDMPSQNFTTNLIRIMFTNMLKVRNEAMPAKVK
jgi:hypothetical protein